MSLDGADAIVVDEPEDALSGAFSAWAGARGARVVRCRLPDAARACMITVDGADPAVAPDLPLLLRPLRGVRPPAHPDERFLWGERFAAVWAAAALTDRPVVNRPDERGWAAGTTMSSVVTERRAGQDAIAPESLWRRWPPAASFRYHQDLSTWKTSDDAAGIELGRSRSLPAMRGWDQVVVVGERGYRVTDRSVHDAPVEDASVRAAAALGLTFATVSWGFPADGGDAVLTKVNAFPTLDECVPVIQEVFGALLGALCE